MARELNHDEAFGALDAAALDALDPPEREAVLAHVARCETCREELSSLRATATNLAFAAPLATDAAMSWAATRDRIRSRLMARAAADAEASRAERSSSAPIARPEPRLAPSSSRGRRRVVDIGAWRPAEWVAVAATVLFLTSAGFLAGAMRDRRALRDALRIEAALADRAGASNESMRALLAARDSLIAGITGRDVAVVQLASAAARAPNAMMFWNRTRNTWTFVAHDLPAPRPGRVYQLWLVTPTAKVSAGTFMPTNGEAMVRATYPLARDSLREVAVSDEPAGGMPQPTGGIVVVGMMR
jgi:hypothetical protein